MRDKQWRLPVIRPEHLRETPRAVRDFKVEVAPINDCGEFNRSYVKATALVATDDTGQTFVRRKIGYTSTQEFIDDVQLDKLKAQMLDMMARFKHEEMGSKE